jgi:hypothetical protein
MTSSKTMAVVAEMVKLLEPLTSEERQRVVAASLMLLGDTHIATPTTPALAAAHATESEEAIATSDLPPKGKIWMKQNSISMQQINHVFHIVGKKVDFIASMPGKSKKEKTYNAYVLTGLGNFIVSGQAQFDDKAARALCEKTACYDSANHSAHLSNKGNEFAGSKDKGWSLTEPGLRRAGELVIELAAPSK